MGNSENEGVFSANFRLYSPIDADICILSVGKLTA
jgi:hypothetical protein